MVKVATAYTGTSTRFIGNGGATEPAERGQADLLLLHKDAVGAAVDAQAAKLDDLGVAVKADHGPLAAGQAERRRRGLRRGAGLRRAGRARRAARLAAGVPQGRPTGVGRARPLGRAER